MSLVPAACASDVSCSKLVRHCLQDIDGSASEAAVQPDASACMMQEPGHCNPVLLVLEGQLQLLPWESLPGLAGQPCALARLSLELIGSICTARLSVSKWQYG